MSIESLKNGSSPPAWVFVQWLSVAPGWHSPLSGLPVSLEKSSSTLRLCFGSTPAPSPLPGSSQRPPISDFCLAHSASSRPNQTKKLSPLATVCTKQMPWTPLKSQQPLVIPTLCTCSLSSSFMVGFNNHVPLGEMNMLEDCPAHRINAGAMQDVTALLCLWDTG